MVWHGTFNPANIIYSSRVRISLLSFLIMDYWYNGYYSGLLTRQIRVRIPGDPLCLRRLMVGLVICNHCMSVRVRPLALHLSKSDDKKMCGWLTLKLLFVKNKNFCYNNNVKNSIMWRTFK